MDFEVYNRQVLVMALMCYRYHRCMSMESPKSLLSVRETLADGDQVHKSLRNAGFYLTTRNPPIVQLGLISRYMDSQRPNTTVMNMW